MSLLSIRDLDIALPEGADRAYAAKDISFDLAAGEILCIVGESGSGKSMSANAVMGLLPQEVKPVRGAITFDGQNILALSEAQMLELRGRRISMIFQEPLSALNPLMRVGAQIAEVFEAHGQLRPQQRHSRALTLLEEVGIPDPESAIRAYPFQLSGGQRQRVMIAMALALEPDILIADEPTTALDVTTQAQILDLIEDLRRSRGMAVIFITHDFGVVADIADRVIVMQTGEIVETGAADEVLLRPRHPYTRALIAAIPRLTLQADAPAGDRVPVLSVEGLNKTFVTGGGGLFGKPRVVRAVRDVSFDLHAGETIGIVGESGSGKSTVGRCLTRLIDPDGGRVMIGGADIALMSGAELRDKRRQLQMIFQDPFSSLNPRARVSRILTEGLIAYGTGRAQAMERARELLGLVGLDPSAMHRFPHEFSGGQRQRIGIARALALEPSIIIADEAVSALDVSIQAQVLDLLAELKARLNLSMLFITHDLRVAARICDRIIVMQKGAIVEVGPTGKVLHDPDTAYTRSLLDAIPGQEYERALAAGGDF
ncbi:MAG: ABC transporter ATP-binding protein [Paracoccus sp. (in: a-proteobacteria)]|jgi:peptide/nickel transport system ATP-binding protein|uniref:ABC transporter ATP-binding protein n=1 Tax=unclassified Paracoccus (in: a-proteobacteria) TaxID=2688777 RepID=UPI000C506430|nr:MULTISPECIES: ABC transporter ATP-binding protein [unclassified Paracoccus (in: a-proteobacteria)]MBA49633.1 microcin ABC transporter ATP-binding protein [Paracoccus sp. (in: a-proteobacteria)]|tara:strand:+ start:5909 stop:7537 length:1629 start_codon:yes stop_codon:yes gene_type:complete